MPACCWMNWRRRCGAPRRHVVYTGNLGRELSSPAASLTLVDKLAMMEQYIGKKVIDVRWWLDRKLTSVR